MRFPSFGLFEPVPLYRYLKSSRVDQFFGAGTIRLSTFEHCRSLDWGDNNEGGIRLQMAHEEQQLEMITRLGKRAYLLCLSRQHSTDLQLRYEADEAFRIDDVAGFQDAISAVVPGFKRSRRAYCLYVRNRTVTRRARGPLNEMNEFFAGQAAGTLKNPEEALNQAWKQINDRAFATIADEPLFLKPAEYALEDELRLVWIVDHNADSPVVVAAPDARRFCSRVGRL